MPSAIKPNPKQLADAKAAIKKMQDELEKKTKLVITSLEADIKAESKIGTVGQALIQDGLKLKDED
jgi:hypothetical protein